MCVCVFTRADAPLTGSKVLPWGSKDRRHQSPRVQTCNAPPVCLASWHPVVAVQGERGADKSRPPGGVERRTERAGLAGCGLSQSHLISGHFHFHLD